MEPVSHTMANLDNKETKTNASEQDVFDIMSWCFNDPQLDGSLAEMMQESAAFYVFLTQLRTIRAVLPTPNNMRQSS